MMPARASSRPTRTVEEPGAMSTRVSFSGPYGVISSQTAPPPAHNPSRRTVRKKPAAPNPFLRVLFGIRRAILLPDVTWLFLLETQKFPQGFFSLLTIVAFRRRG